MGSQSWMPPGRAETYWSLAGITDFNGDGRADLLWRGGAGEVAVWHMDGAQFTAAGLVAQADLFWTFAGTYDFDGDGREEILWSGAGSELAGGISTVSSSARPKGWRSAAEGRTGSCPDRRHGEARPVDDAAADDMVVES